MHAIVVHGGAGCAPRDEESARRHDAACAAALDLGWQVLTAGGSAADAAVAAVEHLENEPSMNAGYGACLTDAGTVELDASIMEGSEGRAGAVALVRRLRNPILLARSLMLEGPHLFMAGADAEALAARRGMALVDPASLISPARRHAFEAQHADRSDAATGTVGAVALDRAGRLAAATSTGGIAGKAPGRIGDSAVIGAGTFADDRAGAASSTGDGEAIIRVTLARMAIEHLRSGLAPERAAALALAEVTAAGAGAGIIVLDRFGRAAGVHTTPHMIWCSRRA